MGRKSDVPERMLAELKIAGAKGMKAADLSALLGINLQYTRLHLRMLKRTGKVVREGVASPVSAPTYRLAGGKKSVNPKKASKK